MAKSIKNIKSVSLYFSLGGIKSLFFNKSFFKLAIFIFCAGFLFFGLAGQASAATYYVRADGTVTCVNKANANNSGSADTSLSVGQFNVCVTFSAGKLIQYPNDYKVY